MRTRVPSSATAAWPVRAAGLSPVVMGCVHSMVARSRTCGWKGKSKG